MLRKILPLALTLTCSAQAFAQETNFNYSEFGIGVGKLNIDGISDDLFAAKVQASLELTENIFVLGKYAKASKDNVDDTDVDIEVSARQLGIGAAFPIASRIDLFGTLNVISVSAEACLSDCIDADDDGYSASVGARAWLTNQVDLIAEATHYELDDSNDSDSFYEVQLGFWPAQQHRIGASLTSSDDSETISVNYTFSPQN
jgi:hypothetical protein